MNYIILNGKNSNDIQGLLIQSLPPISKPIMRTQIETVDGRDGDIVTPLGFNAYNKTMSVGLHGNFDIDEVIKYFNSEGTVTFSNEPYKYYKYKIVAQIDFNRLVRYRTANVVFHVQPFKYSTTEKQKTFEVAGLNEIEIQNFGNVKAKPTITLYGQGTINISLNGSQVLEVNLLDEITIDIESMEAYTGTTLKNRQVKGNYDNCLLNIGKNTISWSGNLSRVVIDKYSRWI